MGNLADSIKGKRPRVITVGILTLAAIVLGLFLYFAGINTKIAGEREAQAAAARVEVETGLLRSPSTDGLTVYLNASDVRAVAVLDGTQYLATSGGLIALDDGMRVKRRYTTLDGLPDNDLTALAVFGGKLYIGTSSAGLIGFDGAAFSSYRFSKPKATRVSALLATQAELLIGTLDGGLFQYDGEVFSRHVNAASGADFKSVTALLAQNYRLYIGTQEQGLYIWREGHIEHVGRDHGLPSPHITGIAVLPPEFSDSGAIAVATDFGVVALDDRNQIEPVSNRPNVTSLAVSGGKLWAGLFGGGLVDLQPGRETGAAELSGPSGPAVAVGLPQSPTRVISSAGKLWALTQTGAFNRDEETSRPAFLPIAEALVGDRVLTTGHITALALDSRGRLWVASFDRGVDVLAPSGAERLSHIEDDRVREVNFVRYDPREDRMFVATSRGLIVFDVMMRQTVITRDKSGIVDDSIAHVSIVDGSAGGSNVRGSSLVLATAGGLSEVSNGRARSITAFHGLASNHLYTSAMSGSRLFVGSLAGLIEMDGLRVVRTYRTSNSGLSHDWVTALAAADGTLYVGTNGGGIDALLPTGEWVNFANDVGRFEVNQNALLADGERILVGTADKGILIYNTRSRRWTRITSGLPSQNVTALAGDERFIYAGTLNGLARIERRVIEGL